MKIKVPTKISLEGYLVPIEYKAKSNNKDNEMLYGQFCNKKKISIYLDSHSSKSELMSTIKHELFHAVLDRCGLREMLSDDLEEAIVVALENHLKSALKFDTQSWIETVFVEINTAGVD